MSASVRYEETASEHAQRLGVSEHFVNVRRRALVSKLQGQEVSVETISNYPYKIAFASIEELEWILQVRELSFRGNIDLHPAPAEIAHRDTQTGQSIQALRQFGFTFGGEGLPRRTVATTYGYAGTMTIGWRQSSPEAEAVADAFYMMTDPAFKVRQKDALVVSWNAIADALNEHGYTRKDEEDWRGDDVRSLIRSPTYCGFYYTKATGLRPAPFIPAPIISPEEFIEAVKASGSRHKAIRAWFDDLAAFVREAE